jgi:tRNA (mo5U34)-methyltransferase
MAAADLAARVAAVPWYHTIEVAPGLATPGEYDLRRVAAKLPIPASLEGQRCLDVGTHDGFWAFELERRGAAEVVAIDLDDLARLDWPGRSPAPDPALAAAGERKSAAFRVAYEALDSRVDRRSLSVYDLSPDAVGTFDFAVIGTLLLHLRDPVRALTAIRSVARRLLVNDVVSLKLCAQHPRTPVSRLLGRPGEPFWWIPNAAALRAYAVAAGWHVEATGRPYLVPNGAGRELEALRPSVRRGANPVEALVLRRGAPHAWVLCSSE